MNKYILGIGGIIIIVAVVFFLKGSGVVKEEVAEKATAPYTSEPIKKNETMGTATVTYTNDGFTPAELTIKTGTVVTFLNQSDTKMWVASANHPTHLLYPEFDEKASVPKGGSYSFTFIKLGAHPYHNHVLLGKYGKVIVE